MKTLTQYIVEKKSITYGELYDALKHYDADADSYMGTSFDLQLGRFCDYISSKYPDWNKDTNYKIVSIGALTINNDKTLRIGLSKDKKYYTLKLNIKDKINKPCDLMDYDWVEKIKDFAEKYYK